MELDSSRGLLTEVEIKIDTIDVDYSVFKQELDEDENLSNKQDIEYDEFIPEYVTVKQEFKDESNDLEANEDSEKFKQTIAVDFSSKRKYKRRHRQFNPYNPDGKRIREIKRDFPCTICSLVFTKSSNLQTHMNSKHTLKDVYKCKYCDYSSTRTDSVRNHEKRIHIKSMDFECDLCNFTAPVYDNIKKHFNKTHVKMIDDRKVFLCVYHCDHIEDDIEYMKTHVYLEHRKQKGSILCKKCNFSCSSNEILKKHDKRLHDRNLEKRYFCHICGHGCPRPYDLKRHMDAKHSKESSEFS